MVELFIYSMSSVGIVVFIERLYAWTIKYNERHGIENEVNDYDLF